MSESPVPADQNEMSPGILQTIPTQSKKLISWVSNLFIVVGFAWVGWLLVQEGTEITSQLSVRSGYWILLSLLLGTVALFPNAIIFHLLLKMYVGHEASFINSVRLMFNGQIIRHIPGRFWGIVYQVNESRGRFSPILMVAANVDMTLMEMALSVIVPVTIYLYFQVSAVLAAGILLTGLTLVALGLRFDWLRTLLILGRRWLPERFEPYLTLDQKANYSWGHIVTIILLFLCKWIIYLIAWQTFSGIYPDLATTNLYLLCVTYTAAWMVGFLSMITPDGLGVREAAFLFLSASLASEAGMAFLVVFVRVWLLIIDLLLFLLGLFLKSVAMRYRHV